MSLSCSFSVKPSKFTVAPIGLLYTAPFLEISFSSNVKKSTLVRDMHVFKVNLMKQKLDRYTRESDSGISFYQNNIASRAILCAYQFLQRLKIFLTA